MPSLCKKCGNYDPTPKLTADSRCPSCGVIHAMHERQPATGISAPATSPTIAAGSRLASPERHCDWALPEQSRLWLCLGAACLLLAVIYFDDDGFVLLLDHANLAFHEAGHLFFGVLGSTAGLYGGTLGQLVFPGIAVARFWQRRQAAGLALSGVWLFENFLNIARYMADARTRLLPLVGGGEHDWYHIFSRWSLLHRDTDIASLTRLLGWLGMIGCMLWLWQRFNAQQRGG